MAQINLCYFPFYLLSRIFVDNRLLDYSANQINLDMIGNAWAEPSPGIAEMLRLYCPFSNKQVSEAGSFLIGKPLLS
jgi:hypothetical protein